MMNPESTNVQDLNSKLNKVEEKDVNNLQEEKYNNNRDLDNESEPNGPKIPTLNNEEERLNDKENSFLVEEIEESAIANSKQKSTMEKLELDEKEVEIQVSHIDSDISPTFQRPDVTSPFPSSTSFAGHSLPTIAPTPTELISDSVDYSFITASWTMYILSSPFVIAIRIPYFIYRILTYTFTLTLDFWSLLGLFFVLSSLVYYLIRYRYLTKYSRLPDTIPAKQGTPFDLHPDITNTEEKDESYQDELMNAFLSSIKVFGYLDRPVFHELAKHLQTKKYKEGDVLFGCDDPTRDFYVVVDGSVEVFVKTEKIQDNDTFSDLTPKAMNDHIRLDNNALSLDDDEEHTDLPGYLLMNEVKAGGTVTSLFSILSILTDDLELPNGRQLQSDLPPAYVSTEKEVNATEILSNEEAAFGNSKRNSLDSSEEGELDEKPGHLSRKFAEKGARRKSPLSEKNNDTSTDSSILSSSNFSPNNLSSLSDLDKDASVESPIATTIQDKSSAIDETSHMKETEKTGKAKNKLTLNDNTSAPKTEKPTHRLSNSRLSNAGVPAFPFLKTSDSDNITPVLQNFQNLHPNVMARASCDTTVAIIPATAFSKLAEKFPLAAAHMAQVILTRFQRVTYHTLYRYLGLSKELMRVERSVNELVGYGCPHFTNSNKIRSEQHSLKGKQKQERSYSLQSECAKTLNIDGVKSELKQRQDRKGSFLLEQQVEDIYDREILKMECFNLIADLLGIHVSVPFLNSSMVTATRPTPPITNIHEGPLFDNSDRPLSLNIRRPSYDRVFTQQRRLSVDSVITTDDEHDLSSPPSITKMSSLSSIPQSVLVANVYQDAANSLQILEFSPGFVVVKEGKKPKGLYFVIDGILEASITSKSRKKNLFVVGPGDFACYLTALAGQLSYITLEAKTHVQVAFLSRPTLERLVEKFPSIYLVLGKRLLSHLMPTILHMDMSLEWEQINAGHVLCRQGDLSDSVYIILNGRLRCIAEGVNPAEKKPDKRSTHNQDEEEDHAFANVGTNRAVMSQETGFEVIGEYGRNESIGQVDVFTQSRRPGTIYAIRDTEVTILPHRFLEALGYLNPAMSLELMKKIVTSGRQQENNVYGGSLDASNVNLKNVAILPVHLGVPIMEFSSRLKGALKMIGASVALLNTAVVMSALGKHAFSRMGKLKLMNWLAEQEENHRLILYVADGGVNSLWTQRCIRQADCILLVGLGNEDASIGEFERLLISMKTTARKELVLLHAERHVHPSSTAHWLKNRMWIHAHHHIQMPLNVPKLISGRKNTFQNIKVHFQKYYTRYGQAIKSHTGPSNIHDGLRSDFARLARRLLFKSVALVLGGGGARGIAHVGIIRAFEEAGIPIDLVGGTSIGAFVGGLYAKENDHVSLYGRAKMFSGRAGSIWRKLLDITYPFTAIFTGHEFNRGIWKVFLDTHIEDCWLNYFCVSTNITWSRMEVHRHGYMWRYIRASMTLAGYLPPLCDNGNLLVDGGYLNNLPADVMKRMGAETVIAVDVGLVDDTSAVDYGDTLSGWFVLLQKLNPLAGWIGRDVSKIPQMADVQARLAYVSSVQPLHDVKNMDGVIYLQPPVSMFATLEFGKFNEIYNVGYQYGLEIVEEWKKNGTLDKLLGYSDSLDNGFSAPIFGKRRQSI